MNRKKDNIDIEKTISNKDVYHFFALITLLILTRIGDGITTYLVTPDLKGEKNPLVTYFNFEWIGLIGMGIILVALIGYLTYYQMFKAKFNLPNNLQIDSFGDFISYYYFGEKNKLYYLIYKLPKNKIAFLCSIGFVAPRFMISYSIILIISNTLVYFSDIYNYYLVVYNLWVLLYVIIIPIVWYYFYLFFKIEYQKYKSSIV